MHQKLLKPTSTGDPSNVIYQHTFNRPMALSYRASWLARRHMFTSPSSKRTLITSASLSSSSSPSWHTQTRLPTSRVQIYTSHVHDPYLNLSAEHFLLQNSHPDSTVLFLYANDPCVVIGRNQNPWSEVNLGLLRREKVDLVRRRSGGGAVFHDRGNVNYSVLCGPSVFDRDKHADMVVRALRASGVHSARVNARHDIVVDDDGDDDQGLPSSPRDPSTITTFKISGSAYKLTRLRSLHHGTCLLSSPHLGRIGHFLRSPAERYIKARGVESVRSPVCNVGVSSADFVDAVKSEFVGMYGRPDVDVALTGTRTLGEGLGEGCDFGHEQILKGYRELKVRNGFFHKGQKIGCCCLSICCSYHCRWRLLTTTTKPRQSLEWLYTQTPQFTFSTHPTQDDPRERPPLPANIPQDVSLFYFYFRILSFSPFSQH